MSIDHDPDYWAFSNEDGKLERPDMRQFERDLDAAIALRDAQQTTPTDDEEAERQ